jgi:uncharacterized protein
VTDVLLLALLTLAASAVGTLSGFGTSTIMVPVLTLFFPLPVTLLFVGVIHLFGDVWKMLLFRRGIEWRIILSFGIPGVALSFAGANLSVGVDTALLERLLGGFLLAYVVFLFFQREWKLPSTTALAATGGALSGFFAGIFGVGGAIRGTFLTAFDLTKATYIFTSGAIAFLIDTVRIGTYLTQGVRLEPLLLYGMMAFIPASLVGAFLAKKVVDRIPQRAFRLVIAGVLAVLAVRYLVFPGG